jgi:hypothetical protein
MVLIKMNRKNEKKYRKKLVHEEIEKQKQKLALLVGQYR